MKAWMCLWFVVFVAPAVQGAVLYNVTYLPDAPGGFTRTDVYAINDLGQVAGAVLPGPDGDYRAAMWEADGTLVQIAAGRNSFATGINNSGQIIGWGNWNNPIASWVWDSQTQQFTAIPDLPGGYVENTAYDINDSGQVAGYSQAYSGGRGYLWSPSGGILDVGDLPGGGGLE